MNAIVVVRKRGDKSDATRTSSVSEIVVRQQTKQGRWLRLGVTLASYSTSSGRLVLCLNHILGFEPINYSHSSPNSSIAGYTTRVLLNNHVAFSGSMSSLQNTHCKRIIQPAVKVESSTTPEHHRSHPASQPAEPTSLEVMPDTKMRAPSRCWIATDMQLAWAGCPDSATDRTCHWQINGKRPHSCTADKWPKPYNQRLAPDTFISYQDVNSCNQLQQLLNCDSSYMVTTQSAHSTDQSAHVDRNISYEN